VAFVWGQDQRKAFDDLKLVMASPPVFRMSELSRTFILQTDESFIALGAILLHDFDWSSTPTHSAPESLESWPKFLLYWYCLKHTLITKLRRK
jgi:hypothetical protein